MLDTLITNKTRLKLLLRFFLNPESSSYLRGLESDFGESTNAIRIELNRFEAAGLLVSWEEKNRKMFGANREHPLFEDIRSILRKHAGVDTIVEKIVKNLGEPDSAYLLGFINASTVQTPLRLIVFGTGTDPEYLTSLTEKAAVLISRPIRPEIRRPEEEQLFVKNNPQALLIWKRVDNIA